MPPISFIVGIFTTIAAAAALPVPQPGELRTFKDWTVGCDNGGNCETVSLVPAKGAAGYDDWDGPISIVRTGGSDDIFKIRVLFEAKDMDRYKMIVDGDLVDTGPIVQGDYPIEIVGQDAIKVAKAIINGRHLIVQGPTGESITRISLAGSAAALRYIDQKQNRAGTGTALVAKGSRDFSPASTEVPTVVIDQWNRATMVPDASALVALVESSKCKNDRYGLVEDQAYPLGQRGNKFRALVLISCGSGAYNFSSAPYIGEYIENGQAASGWTFTPARFDRQPSWGGEGSLPLLVNANWDEQAQTLNSYGKGRGLGDCGSAQNYIWDGEQFRMIDASAMDECRGAYEWITIWRAKYQKLESAGPATK